MLLLLDDDGGFNLNPPFPRSLFSAGEQGIWLDPSDFSTLFQDAAGTTPVTALGQPVGLALDKSGRGNHASQTTSASRPTLQQDSNGMYYLSFDGTDDGMATPSINFTGTDKVTVWAGVRKLSDAARGIVCELSSAADSNNGAFYIDAPPGIAYPAYRFYTRGSSSSSSLSVPSYAAPITNILTGIGYIAGDSAILRVNGAQAASSAMDQGTGNYGNYPLYIGSRSDTSRPFNGRIYQLIVRGAESNADQIAATEAWCNSKTMAY